MVKQRRSVAPRVLDEIVKGIVEVARPERIILFGSAARGQMGPHSDVDLLIVVPGPVKRRTISDAIYRKLGELPRRDVAVDPVVVTTQDVERFGDSHPLIIKPALREGRVLYVDPNPPKRSKATVVKSAIEEEALAAGRFLPDDPREWLNRARSNLAGAKALVPDRYLEDLCFEAQQAVEKAIKAVMIRRDIEFPYVHDIKQLLDVLEASGEEIPQAVRAATGLSRLAVVDRYPSREEAPTDEEYRAYLATAEAVVRWAEERITQ